MADHVAIDLSFLRETSRRLGRAAETLGAARGTAHEDAHGVRQRDLGEAMQEFADNWRVHRERLVDMASGGHKFVTGAADAYDRLDHDLSAALDGDHPSGDRGAGKP